jgi:hypothetical protein
MCQADYACLQVHPLMDLAQPAKERPAACSASWGHLEAVQHGIENACIVRARRVAHVHHPGLDFQQRREVCRGRRERSGSGRPAQEAP